jgi:ribosomal protein S18 acetylase RimI-like enzyme
VTPKTIETAPSSGRSLAGVWRQARPSDDPAIVTHGLALYAEDPSPIPVPEASFHRTLAALRAAPWRGRALVLELDERIVGYALLVSIWSNELGGEVCELDELYVAPAARGRGWATGLIELVAAGSDLGLGGAVAMALMVTPGNARARALYERLGFEGGNICLVRRLASPPPS